MQIIIVEASVHQVGPRGEVVGVDPDKARIKIAQEKFKDVKNLHFIVGDSSSSLPHENEGGYYDLHFSSLAFQWCVGNQKKVYLQKAYECLKTTGRLAILTIVSSEKITIPKDTPAEFLSLAEYKQTCEACLFNVVRADLGPFAPSFPNFDEFKAWLRATSHRDLDDMGADWVKTFMERYVKISPDGSVQMDHGEDIMLSLVAVKADMK